ncbi:MAG: hypothetical protein ACI8ZB_004185 [Desulforhopalus sp.]|jgi:hypothetical protein
MKVADTIIYCINYHKINSRPNTLADQLIFPITYAGARNIAHKSRHRELELCCSFARCSLVTYSLELLYF